MYHGDIRLGDTIDVKFTTVDASGLPTTLAGVPVISAYPGNSLTELTAGITLTVDFDARTGMHNVRVVATSANGYLTATNYVLAITTGTVAGASVVGYVVGAFSIEARSALMPTTAARTLVVDAAGLADANTVKIGPTGAGTAQTAGDVGIKTGFAIGVGGIATTAFAAGAVDAAAIATDAITSAEFAVSAAQRVADETLNRNIAGGASGGARNVRSALRVLRNKVAETGGTATVYQEDDLTADWTATVTRTANTNAITTVAPV